MLELAECVNVQLAATPVRCYAVNVRDRQVARASQGGVDRIITRLTEQSLLIPVRPWERLAAGIATEVGEAA